MIDTESVSGGFLLKKWLAIALVLVIVAIAGFATSKKVSPVSWGWWGEVNTTSGLALQGYDPVAYFSAGRPTVGDSQFTYDWNGAAWQFASAKNRDLFAGSPESYAPQFGGFCSFAVGKGVTADISPTAWHIENGRLYLFADEKVKADWVAAIDEGSMKASVENWSKR
jgi:YHS domain-containing protein